MTVSQLLETEWITGWLGFSTLRFLGLSWWFKRNPKKLGLLVWIKHWSLLSARKFSERVIVAYCFRVRSRWKCPFSVNQIERDKLAASQLTYEECLQKLLKSLTRERVLHILRTLCPSLDEDRTIRLKSKSRLSGLSPHVKHPILLSSMHLLVVMMLRKAHKDNFHYGTEYVRSILQKNFWLLGLRNGLRSIRDKCVKCSPVNTTWTDRSAKRRKGWNLISFWEHWNRLLWPVSS